MQGKSHELAILKGRSTGIGSILTSVLPKIYGTPRRLQSRLDLRRGQEGCLWGADRALGSSAPTTTSRTLDSPCSGARTPSPRVGARDMQRERVGQAVRARTVLLSSTRAARVPPNVPTSGYASRRARTPRLAPRDGTRCLVRRTVEQGIRRGISPMASTTSPRCSTWTRACSFFPRRWRAESCRRWNEELLERTPEWAEPRRGVAAADIRRLARQFAACRALRPSSWISTGVAMTPNGAFTALCCFALNGLVGSMFAKGGRAFLARLPHRSGLAERPSIPRRERACSPAARNNGPQGLV